MLLRMTLDPRTPVLIGQGQVLDRSVDPAIAKHPVALMAEALTAAAYRDLMLRFPAMLEWTAAAKAEPEEVEELDVEF